ncbi:MAG: hypothetical protein ABSC61_11850 [Anaerolineales bacterium]
MIKSGIIVGAIAFVYLLVTGIAMGLCTPVEAIILGLLAGALAVFFDKSQLANKAALSGGVAGLIAGILGIIGNVIGTLVKTYVIFTPETVNSLAGQITGMGSAAFDSTSSTLGTFVSLGCCAILNLVLMVGLGALGGYLWYLYKGKNAAPPPSQIIS